MTFSETSAALDKAIDVVQSKKTALDTAIAAHNKAQEEYNYSVNEATKIRTELDGILSSILPIMGGRVRAA